MYVCMVITYSRVWINRVRLPILLVVSWTGKMNVSLSPCVPENLVSRDGFSRPVRRQPAHLHTMAESGAYLRDPSWVPRRRPFMKPSYAIGSVPSLSGHAIEYRWRSLPRVRRDRASKPQGSSERVLPWQITTDQLIFASLSHTHYWYEVGMLKVPAVPTFWLLRGFRRVQIFSWRCGEQTVGTSFSLMLPTTCATHISKNLKFQVTITTTTDNSKNYFLDIGTWLDLLNSKNVEVPIPSP